MTVLILNRGPLAKRVYHEWLADYPGPLLLLTSQESLDAYGEELPATGYLRAVAVTDYEAPGTIEASALELAGEHRIEYVIATMEADLERAGHLRDRLGLPGQSEASARAFRDKLVMKRHATAAGIPVAEHAPVGTAEEVRAFAEAHGFPLVLKVRDGFSSIGQRILHSAEELEGHLADHPELPANLLAEAFVHGSMFHVDGMILDGAVAAAWPSQYLYQLGSFGQDDKPRLDVTLDRDDPLGRRLLAFVDEVVAALPTPADTTFHAEVFHTPDDRLVLCEIASRNGGALIKSVLETLYDVDFPVSWVRVAAGLPIPVPRGGERMVPGRLAGQLLILKRPGLLRSLPGRPPFDWVTAYEQYVEPGRWSAGAASSGDFMVAMVIGGPDRATVEARLGEAAEWFESRVVIEPGPEVCEPPSTGSGPAEGAPATDATPLTEKEPAA
ncbi:acetyl-CoA carboxylase biotin carboxylase subunit family protein [Kitasatospora sp. NBC_00315]|uniref:ATP-grasp domain-containing protein n=1 Tax=Kitasatospora sp. NBC_00315 TaxID=2975963 RepID=UPI00324D0644